SWNISRAIAGCFRRGRISARTRASGWARNSKRHSSRRTLIYCSFTLTLAFVDYVILALYFAFVLGIGWRLRKRVTTSGDFLLSGRAVPVWITSLAFLAANLGAQELIGMAASGAKYGIMTSHFYWIGAVPAMIFVGVFMMSFYY